MQEAQTNLLLVHAGRTYHLKLHPGNLSKRNYCLTSYFYKQIEALIQSLPIVEVLFEGKC